MEQRACFIAVRRAACKGLACLSTYVSHVAEHDFGYESNEASQAYVPQSTKLINPYFSGAVAPCLWLNAHGLVPSAGLEARRFCQHLSSPVIALAAHRWSTVSAVDQLR